MPNIKKAYAIKDAKISFVSLVDKAANKHTFLVTKADDGNADFQSYGNILEAVKKADDQHFVTGIVYEPMVEDSQGNFMTEDEITKAAYWYAENAGNVDIQHSFEPINGAKVVESYVTKCDEEIGGQPVKKGSWIMTMKINDNDLFDKIQKGEITGFSMGGRGVYDTTDVDLSNVANDGDELEKYSTFQNIKKQIASIFGFDNTVAKGEVKDNFKKKAKNEMFWDAFYSLNDALFDHFNPETGEWGQETDEQKIDEALGDFVSITENLLNDGNVLKSLEMKPVEKAGKAMSSANVEKLRSVYDSLGDFLSKFEEREEDDDVTKAEVEQIVTDAIQKAMHPETEKSAEEAKQTEVEKAAAQETALTSDDVQKMVDEAVQKAVNPEPKPEAVTKENIQEIVSTAVKKAMDPVLKSTGIPTNLNDSQKNVQKNNEEECYLHDFL